MPAYSGIEAYNTTRKARETRMKAGCSIYRYACRRGLAGGSHAAADVITSLALRARLQSCVPLVESWTTIDRRDSRGTRRQDWFRVAPLEMRIHNGHCTAAAAAKFAWIAAAAYELCVIAVAHQRVYRIYASDKDYRHLNRTFPIPCDLSYSVNAYHQLWDRTNSSLSQ